MPTIERKIEQAVKRFLALLEGQYQIVDCLVYGSRARGTHRADSDVDVAVLLSGEHGQFLATKLNMADLAFDVLLETGILISPLPIWMDEWEHPETYSNPLLLKNIEREGVHL